MEHGGNLWDEPAHRELGEEILDLVAYHFTDAEQREQAIEELRDGLRTSNGEAELRGFVKRALGLLDGGGTGSCSFKIPHVKGFTGEWRSSRIDFRKRS